MLNSLAYRQVMAWITFSVTALFTLYFANAIRKHPDGIHAFAPGLDTINSTILGLIIVSIALTAALSASRPEDAEAPADEFESRIDWRAQAYGGWPPSMGAFLALLVLWVDRSDVGIAANVLIAGLLIGTLVQAGYTILGYRRGL